MVSHHHPEARAAEGGQLCLAKMEGKPHNLGSLDGRPYIGLQEDPQYPTTQGFVGFLKGPRIGAAAVAGEAAGFDQLPTVFAGSRGRFAAKGTLVLPIYWAETPCVCPHCTALHCKTLHCTLHFAPQCSVSAEYSAHTMLTPTPD